MLPVPAKNEVAAVVVAGVAVVMAVVVAAAAAVVTAVAVAIVTNLPYSRKDIVGKSPALYNGA